MRKIKLRCVKKYIFEKEKKKERKKKRKNEPFQWHPFSILRPPRLLDRDSCTKTFEKHE